MIRNANDHLDGSEDGWQWGEAHRLCLRFAYRYASNPSEAEDVAQDALLRAWRSRESLREPDNRRQWLATIVRNEAFRVHSRQRPDPTAEVEQGGEEDPGVVGAVEGADLHAAMDELEVKDRRILEMRYERDMTHPAIAAELGIPEGTVKVRLHRARKKLRRAYALQ